ncbi:chitinase-3-like protein 2 [Ornithodoros turicata]|uniref:chitinase-3-like protein 2 n=1 Tax=Ornithodoros turicata TaxID=34597 RepID=UPI003139BE93
MSKTLLKQLGPLGLQVSKTQSAKKLWRSINMTSPPLLLLYAVVFLGGVMVTFLLALTAIPKSAEQNNTRVPLIPIHRRLIFSRQGAGSVKTVTTGAPMFCFYDRYSERHTEPVKYSPIKHLPARYCSHLVYGYISPGDLKNVTTQASTKSPVGSFADAQKKIKQMVQLKSTYPALRVMVAIGGKHVDSRSFSDELLTEGRREHFAQRAARWLRARGLDGLHVHWMYPGQGNGRPSDRQNLPRFLAQLRKSFDSRMKGRNLVLTLFVPHGDELIDRGYEVKAAAAQVDYLILHGWGYSEPNRAEVSSPLFNRPPERQGSPTNSIHDMVALLADRGAPKSKMILGVSARGISYTLARPEPSVRALLRASHPFGRPGPFTKTAGQLAYYEICYNVYRHNWARVFDAITGCPYAFLGNEWVTYDDSDSLRAKASFIRNQTLAGAALLNVQADDYFGLCGPKNVLARSLYTGLRFYTPKTAQKKSPKVSRVRYQRRTRTIARWRST